MPRSVNSVAKRARRKKILKQAKGYLTVLKELEDQLTEITGFAATAFNGVAFTTADFVVWAKPTPTMLKEINMNMVFFILIIC